jgi:hypothetical protein
MSRQYNPDEIARKLECVQNGSLKLYRNLVTRNGYAFTVEQVDRSQEKVMLKHPNSPHTRSELFSAIHDVYRFIEPETRQQTLQQYEIA